MDEIRAAGNIREVMLPGIIKKQSKSLSAQVITRREPESRRDRKYRQLDEKLSSCLLFYKQLASNTEQVEHLLLGVGDYYTA